MGLMEWPAQFWAKVDTSAGPDACWRWTGARQSKGYGETWTGRVVLAHRAAYELHTGETLGSRQQIDHICFNHGCVNPAHLRPVTSKQNSENRRGAQRNNLSTGVRGVSWDRSRQKYMARIKHNRRFVWQKRFDTLEDAEAAVIAKRLELFTHNDKDRVKL